MAIEMRRIIKSARPMVRSLDARRHREAFALVSDAFETTSATIAAYLFFLSLSLSSWLAASASAAAKSARRVATRRSARVAFLPLVSRSRLASASRISASFITATASTAS